MKEKDCLNSDRAPDYSGKEESTKKSDTKTSSGITWRQFWVISCLIYNNFWTAACFSLQAPFFPKEAELKGATPTQYGMVFSVFELSVIITSPIYGRLIPTVSPKFLIASGVFLEGGACVLFGALDWIPAGTVYIAMAFVVRIVEGLGAAAFMTASFTIVAAEFPDAVGKSFSLVETSFGFGLIAGPTIGGALYQVGDFFLPFAVSGGLQVFGAVLLLLFMPSNDEIETPKSGNLKKFLLDPGILNHTIAIVTSLLFIGFNSGTLEPHLRQFGLSPVLLGTIFIITGGVYALTTPIWGWIVDKGANPYTIITLGYFVTAVGVLFIGPVPFIPFKATLWTVISSLVVVGLGMAAKLVAAFTGALKLTSTLGFPDNLATYGMVSGLFSFACSLGAFIGPSLGGFLLDTTGYETGTIVIFAEEVVFLSLLLAFLAWKRKKGLPEVEEERAPLLRRGTFGSSTVVYPKV